MSDNRKRDIFYGVVAVATLIVALVGATLAYFSIAVSSNEGAINAKSAIVSIEYKDGQNVIAQATDLIPATLDVVKAVYEHNMAALTTQYGLNPEEDRTNVCVDSNGNEVCSIYRFSLKSDIVRNALATLRSESNEFQYLAYAVRDVTNGSWLILNPTGNAQSISLTSCDNEAENDANKCYTTDENSVKTYNQIALNSVFGYKANLTFENKTIGPTEQVYDVVLFIKENNDKQDVDQGKQFRGTIIAEVVDQNSANGRITGEANY